MELKEWQMGFDNTKQLRDRGKKTRFYLKQLK